MKRLLILMLPLMILAGPLTAPAAAQTGDYVTDQVLGAVERRIIREYYASHGMAEQDKGKKHKGTPPGLAKKGGVPPGLAKKQALPPGIRYTALPADLERRLPPVRAGQRRVMVDGTVVLIDAATNLVLDYLLSNN